jgi:hypothetical protein
MLYLYGVGFDPLEPPDAVAGVGHGADEFRVVAHHALAALVGPVASPGPAATSRNLATHERVADAIAATGAFLPARFGTVVADEPSLRGAMLEPQEAPLTHALARIEGCVEMRVTIRHDLDGLMREALTASPTVARLRRRVAGRPAAASYYDRIALGEAARNEALRLQQRDLETLQRAVGPVVRAARLLSGPDGTTSRLAYLVETTALDRLDAQLESYGQEHGGRLQIDLVGPLAVWDFTEVEEPSSGGGGRPGRRAVARVGGS